MRKDLPAARTFHNRTPICVSTFFARQRSSHRHRNSPLWVFVDLWTNLFLVDAWNCPILRPFRFFDPSPPSPHGQLRSEPAGPPPSNLHISAGLSLTFWPSCAVSSSPVDLVPVDGSDLLTRLCLLSPPEIVFTGQAHLRLTWDVVSFSDPFPV